MGIKRMTEKMLPDAMECFGDYYAVSSFFQNLWNQSPCKERYITEYTECYRELIREGHCYTYKGAYLVAADLETMKSESPELFETCFGMIWHRFEAYKDRETDKVMYIVAVAGNKLNYYDNKCYSLYKEFLKMYKKHYVVYTDAPDELDTEEEFMDTTGMQRVVIAGRPYYRNKRC